MNIQSLNTKDLLALYSNILEELLSRKVVRTANNPVADYAEYLVADKMNLTLANNSNSGYDALDKDGVRYQIKSRRFNNNRQPRQLGVIRDIEKNNFDFLIAVLFDFNFNALEVYKIPKDVIMEYARFSTHQRGHILTLRGGVLSDKRIIKLNNLFLIS
jgi:hypothetical protein